MKVRWREHEIILVTVVAASALISYSRYMADANAMLQLQNLFDQKRNALIHEAVHFNFFRNVFFPGLGTGFMLYFSYLWIALYTIPRLVFPKKDSLPASSTSLKKGLLQPAIPVASKKYRWF